MTDVGGAGGAAAGVERAVMQFADSAAIAIVTADRRGVITFWNRAATAMFGHAPQDVVGRSLDLLVPPRFRQEHGAGLARVAAGGQPRLAGKTVEVVALHRDGHEFPIEIAITAWGGETGTEFGAQIQDITDRRAREERLQHLANHDPLTGLMNRTGFHDRLSACLGGNGMATLLAIDLDGFKTVNDTFGHPVGDALLQTIAIRLQSSAAAGGVLARIGGDEFALLIDGRNDPIAARATATTLLRAFADPFQIAGHFLQVGLSIGIAVAPMDGGDAEDLMLKADLALLAAKRGGGRAMRFFDKGLSNRLAAQRAFKDEVRRATERQEWELVYQPQVRLADGAIIGAEALLRWRHPVRGRLAPAAFLPVLENHAVAYEVGTWVIEQACAQLAAWRAAGRTVPRMSVNLFAAQFAGGTLERDVHAALGRHGLAPGDLEIEVTETIALRPDDQIIPALQALREAGVGIAFDDFGTGFASLTTLKALPVSRLKIDRAFVHDLCEARHSAAIVLAIVSLCDRLGLEVIAEGIETPAQRAALLALGCETGQGHLFGRPAAADVAFAADPARPARRLRSGAAQARTCG